MIFNCVSISLHKKRNKFTIHFLCYLLLFLKFDHFILYPFFFTLSHFLTFLQILKLDLNFEDFYLLDVIANMLLKSSAFIRSLNMHLYQSNINLKIDIPYLLPLPHIF